MSCDRDPDTGPDLQNTTLTNWSQQVTVSPRNFFYPTSIDQLVAIVNTAEADGPNGSHVRAIGSAWSFTNIIDTPDYLAVMGKLNGVLSETMSTNPAHKGGVVPPPIYSDPVFPAFTNTARTSDLLHVEAGIMIHELCLWLEDYKTNRFPPGSTAGDGPHGWALPTLGGSGGQTIVGAISTSTHGGDVNLPPLPDMVRAIHLVGPGGLEWWIEPGEGNPSEEHVVDPVLLATIVPCVAGRVIFNDDLFNAVLVSCGRMGIIYSVVIAVKPQYFLKETRNQTTWETLLNVNGIEKLRHDESNRFLQVLICPYENGDGNHDCFVTTRENIPPSSYQGPQGPPGFSLFDYMCQHPDLNPVLAFFIQALSLAAVTVLGIPIYGIILSFQINAVVSSVTAIMTFGGSIGQALGALVDGVANVDFPGFTDLAAKAINSVLTSGQSVESDREDLSHVIMDTYVYGDNCYQAVSMEVAFDAESEDKSYLTFVSNVFGIINQLKGNRQMVGAYISLRFCSASRAFLAIEQWPGTVCIEIAGLRDLQFDSFAIALFEAEAAGLGATVHWGQINNRTYNDIDNTYPNIQRWRGALRFLCGDGPTQTFYNDFCFQRGLDVSIPAPVLTGKVILPDTSDGTPALAAHNGLLFLAWKGSNNSNLNVEFSANSGNSFGGKYVSSELSDSPPSLVAHNGLLIIAWRGSGNTTLNVGEVILTNGSTNGTFIQNIANKQLLPDTSDVSPALASHNGLLYLAWKGSNNSNLNVEFSADNGNTFPSSYHYVASELTDNAPSLVSHNGSLFIAWRGSGNDDINVAQVDLQTRANNVVIGIRGFRDKVTISSDTTSHGPSLASIRHLLYLGWKGSNNTNLNVMVSQDNGGSFIHKNVSNELSYEGPGMAWLNDRCFMSWKGTGGNFINVARVNLLGSLSDLQLVAQSGRIVQSSFGIPGNFEVAVLERIRDKTRLVHYLHDNSDLASIWVPSKVISNSATGPGSMIQSSFGRPDYPGNFEAVVLEDGQLVHHYKDNSNIQNEWEPGQVVSIQATGPGSIIQSTIGTPGHQGNFEVVVLEGNNLVHYWHDNSDVTSAWHRAQTISTKATGPGSIIQSNFGINGNLDVPGDFEVVVLEGQNLVHYRRDNSDVDLPWQQADIVSSSATGPGTILQSTFGSPQNFEAVVLEGSNLVHYFHDNSNPELGWQRAHVISYTATGPGSIIQSNFGLPMSPGNFEVVVLEGRNLVHYWHDNSDVTLGWNKAQVISMTAIG